MTRVWKWTGLASKTGVQPDADVGWRLYLVRTFPAFFVASYPKYSATVTKEAVELPVP
jgi:hypothetical protein